MERIMGIVCYLQFLLVFLAFSYIILPSTIKEESNTAITLRLDVDTLVKSIDSNISTETVESAHNAGWFTDTAYIEVSIGIDANYFIGIFYTKTEAAETTQIDTQGTFSSLLAWSGNISSSEKTQIVGALTTAQTSLLRMKTDWTNEITLQNVHETIVRDCGEYANSAIMSIILYVASFAHEIELYANQSGVVSPNLDWSHLIINTDTPGKCSSYCYAEKTFSIFTVVTCIVGALMIIPICIVKLCENSESIEYNNKTFGIINAVALVFCLIQIVMTVFTKEDCTPFRDISEGFDVSILQQKHSANTQTTASYDSASFLAWTVTGILATLWCYAIIMYCNIKQLGYSKVIAVENVIEESAIYTSAKPVTLPPKHDINTMETMKNIKDFL